MKTLSRSIATVVLTLSLTFITFAGDIQTPGDIAPPPPAAESYVAGDIQTPGAVAPDLVTTALLSLLQSVMPVL